jgi:hypothetical protein
MIHRSGRDLGHPAPGAAGTEATLARGPHQPLVAAGRAPQPGEAPRENVATEIAAGLVLDETGVPVAVARARPSTAQPAASPRGRRIAAPHRPCRTGTARSMPRRGLGLRPLARPNHGASLRKATPGNGRRQPRRRRAALRTGSGDHRGQASVGGWLVAPRCQRALTGSA